MTELIDALASTAALAWEVFEALNGTSLDKDKQDIELLAGILQRTHGLLQGLHDDLEPSDAGRLHQAEEGLASSVDLMDQGVKDAELLNLWLGDKNTVTGKIKRWEALISKAQEVVQRCSAIRGKLSDGLEPMSPRLRELQVRQSVQDAYRALKAELLRIEMRRFKFAVITQQADFAEIMRELRAQQVAGGEISAALMKRLQQLLGGRVTAAGISELTREAERLTRQDANGKQAQDMKLIIDSVQRMKWAKQPSMLRQPTMPKSPQLPPQVAFSTQRSLYRGPVDENYTPLTPEQLLERQQSKRAPDAEYQFQPYSPLELAGSSQVAEHSAAYQEAVAKAAAAAEADRLAAEAAAAAAGQTAAEAAVRRAAAAAAAAEAAAAAKAAAEIAAAEAAARAAEREAAEKLAAEKAAEEKRIADALAAEAAAAARKAMLEREVAEQLAALKAAEEKEKAAAIAAAGAAAARQAALERLASGAAEREAPGKLGAFDLGAAAGAAGAATLPGKLAVNWGEGEAASAAAREAPGKLGNRWGESEAGSSAARDAPGKLAGNWGVADVDEGSGAAAARQAMLAQAAAVGDSAVLRAAAEKPAAGRPAGPAEVEDGETAVVARQAALDRDAAGDAVPVQPAAAKQLAGADLDAEDREPAVIAPGMGTEAARQAMEQKAAEAEAEGMVAEAKEPAAKPTPLEMPEEEEEEPVESDLTRLQAVIDDKTAPTQIDLQGKYITGDFHRRRHFTFSRKDVSVFNGTIALPPGICFEVPADGVKLADLTLVGQPPAAAIGLVVVTGEFLSMDRCRVGLDPVEGSVTSVIFIGNATAARFIGCEIKGGSAHGIHVQAVNGYAAESHVETTVSSNNKLGGFCAEGQLARLHIGKGCVSHSNEHGYFAAVGGELNAGAGSIARNNTDSGFVSIGPGAQLNAGKGCLAEGNRHGFFAFVGGKLNTADECVARNNNDCGFYAVGNEGHLNATQIKTKLVTGRSCLSEGNEHGYVAIWGKIKAAENCVARKNRCNGFVARCGKLKLAANGLAEDNEEYGFKALIEGKMTLAPGCEARGNKKGSHEKDGPSAKITWEGKGIRKLLGTISKKEKKDKKDKKEKQEMEN